MLNDPWSKLPLASWIPDSRSAKHSHHLLTLNVLDNVFQIFFKLTYSVM